MNNKATNKNNIIFFLLLFLIPVLALDASYYFLNNINTEWNKADQEKKAVQEAEILASEADFGNQLSMLFKKYCDVIKGDVQLSFVKDIFLTSHLEQTANVIFSEPFPKFNLHVFRIASGTQSAEMLISRGDSVGGRRGLCLAFEHLYNLAVNNTVDAMKAKSNEAFAKSLVGQYSDVDSIAREMRGTPTYINLHNKSNWFIWDYFIVPEKGVFGAILTCNEVENFGHAGRLLALRNQRARGRAIGAFVPVFDKLGEPIYQSPLENSEIFCNWAKTITVSDVNQYDKWIKEDLPQGVILGNYTAFCHLERGASHIAVVLVRAVNELTWPKWLRALNLLLILSMVAIIFFGLCYESWPPINLKTRFVLSYVLASILPLCLLSVTAYGYIQQYRNTSINKAIADLEAAMKSFDAQKVANVNEYKSAFTKALTDSRLIGLIKEKGIENELVAQRVIDIFEKDEYIKPLPILGAKVFDEAGNGACVKGSATTNQNIEILFNTCLSANIYTLRSRIKADDPEADNWMKPFTPTDDNDIDNKAYIALTGHPVTTALNKHGSVPFPRKNGDYCIIQIFDYIKIDGKVRYALVVMWDDSTLDDRILQNAFDSYALKNLTHSFMGFRIKGQNVEYIGKKTRHATKKTLDKATELAKLVGNSKRTSTFIDDDILIVAMPSANFSQSVLVGWIDMGNVVGGVLERRLYLILLLAASLVILGICSLRSVGVFLYPATELTKALDAVSNGNLNVSLESDCEDELGLLSREFSGMIDGLKERERLSKLISDQAVHALEKHSNTLLDNTETFDGVALVSDIRNFTGISEENDPMIITDLLNEHFAEMTKVISDNGGLIYKFIGDAIEAVFPERNDQPESASERAFKAGCMMITVLASINAKRKKRGLFTYRMGVGLCKGIMYSGSVGSIETRLDYAILGDALKTAAKFESLSIQNPSFPLIIGENIAEKLSLKGFSFRKIDTTGEEIRAYTIEAIENRIQNDVAENTDEQVKQLTNSANNEKKIFVLQKSTVGETRKKTTWFNILILLFIILCAILGLNVIYMTEFETLKQESDLECSRLIEQLKCDEALKSSFEALCLDFYEEIDKVIYDVKDGQNLDDLIKPIDKKLEKLGRPIPKYFCCKFKSEDTKIPVDHDDMAFKGFTEEFSKKIASIPTILRQKLSDDKDEPFIHPVLGENTNSFNLRSSLFRRSAVATINGVDMLVDTNRFFYGRNNILFRIYGYALCAMPLEIANDIERLNYYKILAGKNNLLAFYNGNEWCFSDNFPEKEINFLKNNFKNDEYVKAKGYLLGNLKLNNNNWKIYTISRKAASSYRSLVYYDIAIFLMSGLIFGIIGYLFRKKIMSFDNSLAFKLRMDIVSAAILPLLTVCFVSYLYVNEDYAVKKAEKRSELQKDMDTLENLDYYFQPLCWNYTAERAKSDELIQLVKSVEGADSKDKKNNAKKELKKYLKNNLCGNGKGKFDGLNPRFTYNQVLFASKNNWAVSVTPNDDITQDLNDLSDFGKIFVDVFKAVFWGKNGDSNSKEAIKREMVVDKMTSVLVSNFGNDARARFVNFPNQPILMSVAYTTIGFMLIPYPNMDNPDYIVLAMVFFDTDKLSDFCDYKNDSIANINAHIASGSIGSEKYIHSCPYIKVGRHNYNRIKENFQALKELILAESWVSSAKLPVSRTIDLNGEHYFEVRPGNKIGDTVFAAFVSDKPVWKEIENSIYKIIFIILLSVILIAFIAQCIISDLLSPIKALIGGAKFAARGDYSFRTNLNRKDELGTLCNSFDKMMKGLEEKQLMNRMVSKTALNVSSGQIDASSKRIDAFLIYVTVPGFNKILKNTDSVGLFVRLRSQIVTIAEIVLNAGGDIDKIMGEKLLIAFQVHNKKPEEIAKTVCKVAHAIETSNRLYYPVAVGVNYGQVISGFLGVGEKRDFTVIGDPVNVAARIATLAENQPSERRMISEPVLKLVGDSVKAEEYGKVSLKGKSELLNVYRIV